MKPPTISDIKKARETITSNIRKTPALTNEEFNQQMGATIFFKCENLQRTGSFKFRGASNAVFNLPDQDSTRGVATHSSGNHGQALALAAKLDGIPAQIVMPEDAPEIKKRAVKRYGAEITFCESTQQARENALQQILDQSGCTFIHPYNNPNIIAGQGTAAMELLVDHPDLDLILAPVGGGGLLSGTAIATKNTKTGMKVIGCEPEMADDACRSFHSGKLQPVENPDTIADGLRTSLSELTFSCIRQYVDDIVAVTEQEIIDAMRIAWERLKIVLEPSAAVPIAAIINQKVDIKGKRTGIIISGGNMDLDKLPWQ